MTEWARTTQVNAVEAKTVAVIVVAIVITTVWASTPVRLADGTNADTIAAVWSNATVDRAAVPFTVTVASTAGTPDTHAQRTDAGAVTAVRALAPTIRFGRWEACREDKV